MSSNPPQLLEPTDFAKRIRSKYPGAYDDIDDITLTKKTLLKYPDYVDTVKSPFASLGDDPSSTISKEIHKFGLKLGSMKRTPSENKAAGGAANSSHLYGNAIDIIGGDRDKYQQFHDYMRDTYGTNLAELLWDVPDHYDHVHLSWNPISANQQPVTESISDQPTIEAQPSISIKQGRGIGRQESEQKGAGVSLDFANLFDNGQLKVAPEELHSQVMQHYIAGLGLSSDEAEAMKGSTGGDFTLNNPKTHQPFTPQEIADLVTANKGKLDIKVSPENVQLINKFKTSGLYRPTQQSAAQAGIEANEEAPARSRQEIYASLIREAAALGTGGATESNIEPARDATRRFIGHAAGGALEIAQGSMNLTPASYAFPETYNKVFDRIREPIQYTRDSLKKALPVDENAGFIKGLPGDVGGLVPYVIAGMIPGGIAVAGASQLSQAAKERAESSANEQIANKRQELLTNVVNGELSREEADKQFDKFRSDLERNVKLATVGGGVIGASMAFLPKIAKRVIKGKGIVASAAEGSGLLGGITLAGNLVQKGLIDSKQNVLEGVDHSAAVGALLSGLPAMVMKGAKARPKGKESLSIFTKEEVRDINNDLKNPEIPNEVKDIIVEEAEKIGVPIEEGVGWTREIKSGIYEHESGFKIEKEGNKYHLIDVDGNIAGSFKTVKAAKASIGKPSSEAKTDVKASEVIEQKVEEPKAGEPGSKENPIPATEEQTKALIDSIESSKPLGDVIDKLVSEPIKEGEIKYTPEEQVIVDKLLKAGLTDQQAKELIETKRKGGYGPEDIEQKPVTETTEAPKDYVGESLKEQGILSGETKQSYVYEKESDLSKISTEELKTKIQETNKAILDAIGKPEHKELIEQGQKLVAEMVKRNKETKKEEIAVDWDMGKLDKVIHDDPKVAEGIPSVIKQHILDLINRVNKEAPRLDVTMDDLQAQLTGALARYGMKLRDLTKGYKRGSDAKVDEAYKHLEDVVAEIEGKLDAKKSTKVESTTPVESKVEQPKVEKTIKKPKTIKGETTKPLTIEEAAKAIGRDINELSSARLGKLKESWTETDAETAKERITKVFEEQDNINNYPNKVKKQKELEDRFTIEETKDGRFRVVDTKTGNKSGPVFTMAKALERKNEYIEKAKLEDVKPVETEAKVVDEEQHARDLGWSDTEIKEGWHTKHIAEGKTWQAGKIVDATNEVTTELIRQTEVSIKDEQARLAKLDALVKDNPNPSIQDIRKLFGADSRQMNVADARRDITAHIKSGERYIEALKEQNRRYNELQSKATTKDEGKSLGAAHPSSFPTDPNISVLKREIEPLEASKKDYTLRQKLGIKLENAKDSAIYNITKITESAKNTYENIKRGVKPVNDFIDAVYNWQANKQQTAGYTKQFQDAINKQIKGDIIQDAITKWVDTGGDATLLADGAKNATTMQSRLAYEQALKLTPDEIEIAKRVQDYYDSMLQQGLDEGILWSSGVPNFINRLYKKDVATLINKNIENDFQQGKLPTTFTHAKARVFQYLLDAEKAGYKPKVTKVGDLVSIYNQEFGDVIAARKFVQEAMTAKTETGEPIVVPAGGGEGVVSGKSGDITVINPNFKPSSYGKGQNKIQLNPKDYVPYEHPAFRNQKFVTSDTNGQPIILKADALVHKDFIKEFKNRFDKSPFDEYKVLKGAKFIKNQIKGGMMIGLFHQTHVDIHALGHRVIPYGKEFIKEIDLEATNTKDAIQHGVKVFDSYGIKQVSEGSASGAWAHRVPILGTKVLKPYTEWLFQDHIPKLKLKLYKHAVKENLNTYSKDIASGKVSETQIKRQTADEVNAAFGELNYEVMGTSKFAQDALSMLLLAPDFTRARLQYVGQALKPYGRVQQKALIGSALVMWAGARVLNGVLNNGNMYASEPDKMFKIKMGDKWIGIRSVPEDIVNVAENPGQGLVNRLNPVVQMAISASYGIDRFGKKLEPDTKMTRVKEIGAKLAPMSLTPSTEEKEILTALGIDWKSTLIKTLGFGVGKYNPKQKQIEKFIETKEEMIEKTMKNNSKLTRKEAERAVENYIRNSR